MIEYNPCTLNPKSQPFSPKKVFWQLATKPEATGLLVLFPVDMPHEARVAPGLQWHEGWLKGLGFRA